MAFTRRIPSKVRLSHSAVRETRLIYPTFVTDWQRYMAGNTEETGTVDTVNTLFITVDSLRRDFLGAYADRPSNFGYDVATPNLDRFAERAAIFDSHYAGSLPCMPARREFLAGVQEFLWRPWGPMEPFDVTVPERARAVGAPSQLITDHDHYFEYGGDGRVEGDTGVAVSQTYVIGDVAVHVRTRTIPGVESRSVRASSPCAAHPEPKPSSSRCRSLSVRNSGTASIVFRDPPSSCFQRV